MSPAELSPPAMTVPYLFKEDSASGVRSGFQVWKHIFRIKVPLLRAEDFPNLLTGTAYLSVRKTTRIKYLSNYFNFYTITLQYILCLRVLVKYDGT